MPKKPHGNRRYAFPFFKTCKVCYASFATHNHTQALRNTTCSTECRQAIPRRRKPLSERKGAYVACVVCSKVVWKPDAWLRKVKRPTCSCRCNGKLRSVELVKHSHKGRAGWTAESGRSFTAKMTGPLNPAWKGGVTYFGSHGNHAGAKYVRCPAPFLAMARKDGYVMEHRLVVAQAMGRLLLRSEVVHHMDHNPRNNALENLVLFATNSDHKRFEARGLPLPIWP